MHRSCTNCRHGFRSVAEPPIEGTKPEFVVSPIPCEIQENERVEFMCQVTGEPTPDLTWFHNDTPLELTGRYSVVERDGYQVLQVTDVTPADAGEYKVAATNVIGEAVCMATMEVQGLTSAYFVISHVL